MSTQQDPSLLLRLNVLLNFRQPDRFANMLFRRLNE